MAFFVLGIRPDAKFMQMVQHRFRLDLVVVRFHCSVNGATESNHVIEQSVYHDLGVTSLFLIDLNGDGRRNFLSIVVIARD